jgi:hypothetical protein
MTWKILNKKTWEDIPERSVFWLWYVASKDKTKRTVQKSIDATKIEHPNKMIMFKHTSKYQVTIKYIPEVS